MQESLIKKFREKNNLTMQEFCELYKIRTGKALTKTRVSSWERFESRPNNERIQMLAKVIEVDYFELFDNFVLNLKRYKYQMI